MTQQQLAQSLGLAQSTVANRLRLLRLSDSVRTEILRLGLTERHARELLRLHDTKMQLQAIDQIACRMLNVRQTEDLIAHMLQGALSVERAKSTPSFSRAWRDWRLFANTMKTAVLELKAAGLNAAFDLHDTGDAVEMRVVVPKARGNPPVGANSPPSIP